jgi:hypothetical protein
MLENRLFSLGTFILPSFKLIDTKSDGKSRGTMLLTSLLFAVAIVASPLVSVPAVDASLDFSLDAPADLTKRTSYNPAASFRVFYNDNGSDQGCNSGYVVNYSVQTGVCYTLNDFSIGDGDEHQGALWIDWLAASSCQSKTIEMRTKCNTDPIKVQVYTQGYCYTTGGYANLGWEQYCWDIHTRGSFQVIC